MFSFGKENIRKMHAYKVWCMFYLNNIKRISILEKGKLIIFGKIKHDIYKTVTIIKINMYTQLSLFLQVII